MNHLPPQAYTKDTLVHAYNWLQTQPQKIKELAVSQDVLIALYSKAKLHGDGIFEKPSFQNFRNDLKNIANMMGEFDSTQPNIQSPQQNQVSPAGQRVSVQAQSIQVQTTHHHQEIPISNSSSVIQQGNSMDLRSLELLNLDSKSLLMAREIRDHFNLSSETEAIRLLISIGYQKIRTQF
jgi:hypothetical protein